MNKDIMNSIIKKIIFTFILTFISSHAFAATYYVRADGGTGAQCNGLSDAPYPGSGVSQSCAFSHPYWALAPQGNNPSRLAGGDTLIIDGSNNAQYMFGYGAPNTSDGSKCSANWPWDCYLRPVPSGPSPSQPTRILGKGWDSGCANPPEIWGNERASMVFNLNGSSNVELQCMEITDHSSCQENGPNPCNRSSSPYGAWAGTGISASDSSNVLLKNINIHGMAHDGIQAGRLKDWTLEDTQIVANATSGWNGDIGKGVSSNSGNFTFNRVRIEYNGCGETYPGKLPYNCYSQSQGGYGDGIGTQKTGGNWSFINSNVSHNTQDGIDLLYHDGTGTVTIIRTRAEGNAGNQIKSATSTIIDNSIVIGNCAYFRNNPITWQSGSFDHCRAAGNTLALGFVSGSFDSITNSTITSNGNDLIISLGTTCDGSESIRSLNNIFLAGPYFYGGGDNASLYYPSGATGNGDGSCGTVKLMDDYSVIYGTKGGNSDCAGKVHSKCADPKLTDSMNSYYSGNSFNATLQPSSPAVGAGFVISGASTLDYTSKDRGTKSWDIGALQITSSGEAIIVTPPPPAQNSPTVTLTQPLDASTFNAGDNLVMTANASEVNGTIASVSFYNGDALLGSVAASPYTFTWTNLPAGSAVITAKAVDAKGITVVSDPVTIQVNAPAPPPVPATVYLQPSVVITSPLNQSTFTTSDNISIVANAVSKNSTIRKVYFYDGTDLLGWSANAPYTFVWNNPSVGTHTINAETVDMLGVWGHTATVTVSVTTPSEGPTTPPAPNTTDVSTDPSVPTTPVVPETPAPILPSLPVVTITSPVDQQDNFIAGSDITITAGASEKNGTISKVDFYIFNAYLGTSTSAPYQQTWRNIKAGVYSFTAKATDSTGISTTSKMITVYIKPPALLTPDTTNSVGGVLSSSNSNKASSTSVIISNSSNLSSSNSSSSGLSGTTNKTQTWYPWQKD